MSNAPSSARKTRGPSQRVTEQLLQATLGILEREGVDGLKMELVAERAGVHKTTLYRRYGDINELVKAVIEAVDMSVASLPDTGSLRGDVRAMVESFTRHFSEPGVLAIIRWVVGHRPSDSALVAWIDAYWLDHSRVYQVVFDRAEARGEPVQRERFMLAMELIVGPMLLRQLVTGLKLDQALIDNLAEIVFAAVSG